MGSSVRRGVVVAVLVAAGGVAFGIAPGRASACSCARVDPIDAIAEMDAVFVGEPIERLELADLDDGLEAWRFDVTGVITGDVAEEEIVVGNGATSCGPVFLPDAGRVVVFASQRGTRFGTGQCLRVGSADVDPFLARLAEPLLARGTGPPAALRVGPVGTTDIAVLDASGRALAGGVVGAPIGAAVAVCQGTTKVVLAGSMPSGSVLVVDLADWSTSFRAASLPFLQPNWEPIACYDGGERVVVASSANELGVLRLVSSTWEETVTYEADPVYGTAVFHPAGTAILLPVGAAGMRVLRVDDLTAAVPADIRLPAGTSVGDAAVSPDGTHLAMLATLDGTPAVQRTPNTHVIVVELANGIPVADSARVVALDPASVGLPDAPALRLVWVDDATWAIEHVGNVDDWIEFVAADGTQITPPVAVGWGGQTAPVPGGILRWHLNGVQLVTEEGVTADGDPQPDEGFDRWLSITSLRGAAPFDLVDATPPPYRVTPPSTGAAPPLGTEPPPSTAAERFGPGTTQAGAAETLERRDVAGSSGTSPGIAVAWVGAALIVAATVAWTVWYRRTRR